VSCTRTWARSSSWRNFGRLHGLEAASSSGHANPLITLEHYSHLLDARVTEAASRFDPARLP